MPQRTRSTMSSPKLMRDATGVSRVATVDRLRNPAMIHLAPNLSARRPPGICEMR